jgi:hypothetical protein
MATSYSPKIITDGLVLCLDAGDKKSYSGSGSTWTDRSGNGNDFTGYNSPAFSSDNGGNIAFDGADEWYETTNLGLSNHTKEVWFRSNDNTQGSGGGGSDIITILGPYIIAAGADGKYTYIGIYNTNLTFRIDDGANSHRDIRTQSYSADVWYCAAVTYNSTSGNAIAYLNGAKLATISYTTGVTFNSEKEYIAKSDNSQAESFNGSVASVKMYNRALTEEEILQNYNATKGRFGL